MWYKVKRIMMRPNGVEKQVRPIGWKPWANTLAYYPLTDDFNDHKGSGTAANLTNSWGSITTVWWIKCAYYNWSSYSVNTSLPSLSNTRTISCWWRPASTSGVMWIVVTWYTWSSYHIWWLQQSSWVIWGSEWATTNQSVNSWFSVSINTWYNLVTTIENWTTAKIYVNWELKNTISRSNPIVTASWLAIWAKSWSTFSEKATWYVRDAIIEGVAWSTTNVSDYYNLTKWNYWL